MVECQVVGIVADTRSVGTNTNRPPRLYAPLAQSPWPSLTVIMKSASSDPMTLAKAARHELSAVDRSTPVRGMTTLEQLAADSMNLPRFRLWLMSIFGGAALLLAAVGVYGVTACSIAQRTREIGIRKALGATGLQVLRRVLMQESLSVVFGLALGAAGAWAFARVLSRSLYAVSALDHLTFGAAVGTLTATALLSILYPARRAARVHPVIALRHE